MTSQNSPASWSQQAEAFDDDTDIDEFISSELEIDAFHFQDQDQDQNLIVFQSQETICNFFLEKSATKAPEWLLKEFKQLFFSHQEGTDPHIYQALNTILLSHNQDIFVNTLKRTCYILINNWSCIRKQSLMRELISLFGKISLFQNLSSTSEQNLYQWLTDFVSSEDYRAIENCVNQENQAKKTAKFTSEVVRSIPYYPRTKLLKPAQEQIERTFEEIEAEKIASRKIREQFKKELAIYTTRFRAIAETEDIPQNPTALGDDVMNLIHRILKKRGGFSHVNLANIFLNQTQGLLYRDFKHSLIKYLFFPIKEKTWVIKFRQQLSEEILILYPQYDGQVWDSGLLLRTCNRIIESLTTQNRHEPSTIFTFLAAQGKYLALSIFLLKILLISRPSYTHLESCIVHLTRYYQNQAESECDWLLHFLDTLKIILTIYIDNMDYNLVAMDLEKNPEQEQTGNRNYRIFSQTKLES
jgi:hypothetical protein